MLRWGIVGPGWIATQWTATVLANTDQRVVAVASSSTERAEAFARAHGVDRSYGDHEALLDDPDVDAVYIASTNELHHRQALAAIAAGKHVLVEKPLGCSAAEARGIAAAAASAGVFAMEAMWTRFLPQTDVLLQLVGDGGLGRVGFVDAEFCAPFTPEANARVFASTIGGGALLDIGVYPLSFARFVLGAVERIAVSGTLTATGVDARSVIVQQHADGAQSVALTALDLGHAMTARVIGERASAVFTTPFFQAGGFDLVADEERLGYRDPNGIRGHAGLCYQVVAAAHDVAAGRLESALWPLAESAAVLDVIDEARRRIGGIAP